MIATTTLVAVSCCNCGVEYAIPDSLNNGALGQRGPNGRSIYCPNGHSWHYVGETEAEKERRLRKQEQDRSAALRADLDRAEASLRTTRGVVTKMRKRAIVGSCQFCHRNFANVARHVASQHPAETA
jgi:hypothetical protein